MPKLLFARAAHDAGEERQVRKLAGARHAPGDWITRARIVVSSWDGMRVPSIAERLGCHPETVRRRLHRFNAEGIDGLGDRPGPGRRPRLTEAERSRIIALVKTAPPGRPVTGSWLEGLAAAEAEDQAAVWTLDTLTGAARAAGIEVHRSQIRRILLAEGVRWRRPRSWTTSKDPEFAAKERRSQTSTRTRRPGR
jgi:transposase